MSVQACSSLLDCQSFPADQESVGGRLIRMVIAGQQRKSNRRIWMYVPARESGQADFRMELERGLLGL
jgi:hypothetical protein